MNCLKEVDLKIVEKIKTKNDEYAKSFDVVMKVTFALEENSLR